MSQGWDLLLLPGAAEVPRQELALLRFCRRRLGTGSLAWVPCPEQTSALSKASRTAAQWHTAGELAFQAFLVTVTGVLLPICLYTEPDGEWQLKEFAQKQKSRSSEQFPH